MAKYLPEMKRLMEKRVSVSLNANREVTGTLRGYDQFMNIVLEDAEQVLPGGAPPVALGTVFVRGNSIVVLDVRERVAPE
mmetsp:Transcript_10978/g.23500  ORF Transcript_10978/g.23500 Transcript_10978/m.23500 type:complete len:80 (-) Transcript_10978:325-564(-)